MEKKITITIVDRRANTFWRRLLTVVVIVLGPTSIGILLDNPAMQWLGFVFTLLLFFGFSAAEQKKSVTHSITEARRRLDELEREGGA